MVLMVDRFTKTGWKRVDEQVGRGTLRGHILVDQLYAEDQHNNPTYKHDDGGMQYLTRPLVSNAQTYMSWVAGALLHAGPVAGMRRAVDHLNDSMQRTAPHEHGYLARSGRVTVYDNGRIAYRKGPAQRRLSKAELNAIVKREPGL